MRALVVLALLALPLLAGCVGDHGRVGSGTHCGISSPLQDGFRVEVPATVGDAGREAATRGLCVRAAGPDGGSVERKTGEDGVAWFPVGPPGLYRFSVHPTDPGDRYCAYVVEGQAEHAGTGIVEVTMAYQDVRMCS